MNEKSNSLWLSIIVDVVFGVIFYVTVRLIEKMIRKVWKTIREYKIKKKLAAETKLAVVVEQTA
jgi:hypothetical protein